LRVSLCCFVFLVLYILSWSLKYWGESDLFFWKREMKLDGKTIQAAIMQLVEDYKFDPYQVIEVVKLGIRS